MQDQEVWEVCEEFPDFAVSDLGRIEDLERHRFVPTRSNNQGFQMATIRHPSNGRYYTRSVALLIAKAFCHQLIPVFDSVIHLNGDRSDCRAMNLMWRSRPFALRYHDMFTKEPYRVSVYIPKLDEFYFSLREACTTYGLVEYMAYLDIRNRRPCWPYSWYMEEAQE